MNNRRAPRELLHEQENRKKNVCRTDAPTKQTKGQSGKLHILEVRGRGRGVQGGDGRPGRGRVSPVKPGEKQSCMAEET